MAETRFASLELQAGFVRRFKALWNRPAPSVHRSHPCANMYTEVQGLRVEAGGSEAGGNCKIRSS
jgi:hypothetical protein